MGRNPIEEVDVRERNPKIVQSKRRQDFSRDQQHFKVSGDARLTDMLNPELVEFTRRTLRWFVVTEYFTRIAEPNRPRLTGKARRDSSRNQRGQLGPKRQQRAVTIDESIGAFRLLSPHPA